MNNLQLKIAKGFMRLFSNHPEFTLDQKLSEIINHNQFIQSTHVEKRTILNTLAQNHFLENEKNPFETYFPKYDFKNLFHQKIILDLGCWCGGKAVSNAEKWGPSKMVGVDINANFINAAKIFSSGRNNSKIEYDFKVAYGESLPFEDNYFDGIITYDVFEHVKSVSNTLKECKRVLKTGGLLFAVFPSYYTIGESHLDFVTKFPIIHWLFPSQVLNQAYYELIKDRGKEAYWYKPAKKKEDWMKYDAGIGINGTTFNSFMLKSKEAAFSEIKIIPTPLFSVGKKSRKYPLIKLPSYLIYPLTLIPGLKDLFSHRIVAVLRK